MLNDDWESYSEECANCGKIMLKYQMEEIKPYFYCSNCAYQLELEEKEQENKFYEEMEA